MIFLFNVQRNIGNGWRYVLTLRTSGRHEISINRDVKEGNEIRDVEFLTIQFEYNEHTSRLIIINIQRTPRFTSWEEHLGTVGFNQLLLCLAQRGKTVKYISGKLSYVDAPTGYKNWFSSIPFYHDFPKHLSSQLPYHLEFEIKDLDISDFPIEKSQRERFIQSIPVRDYQFQYTVIPKLVSPNPMAIITYTADI